MIFQQFFIILIIQEESIYFIAFSLILNSMIYVLFPFLIYLFINSIIYLFAKFSENLIILLKDVYHWKTKIQISEIFY